MPDPHGSVGEEVPLLLSASIFIDAAGHITMRSVNSRSAGKTDSVVLAPYTAARIAYTLAELVNATGQFSIDMTVIDPDAGTTKVLSAPKTTKN